MVALFLLMLSLMSVIGGKRNAGEVRRKGREKIYPAIFSRDQRLRMYARNSTSMERNSFFFPCLSTRRKKHKQRKEHPLRISIPGIQIQGNPSSSQRRERERESTNAYISLIIKTSFRQATTHTVRPDPSNDSTEDTSDKDLCRGMPSCANTIFYGIRPRNETHTESEKTEGLGNALDQHSKNSIPIPEKKKKKKRDEKKKVFHLMHKHSLDSHRVPRRKQKKTKERKKKIYK